MEVSWSSGYYSRQLSYTVHYYEEESGKPQRSVALAECYNHLKERIEKTRRESMVATAGLLAQKTLTKLFGEEQ